MTQNVSINRFLNVGEEPMEILTPIAGYDMVDLFKSFASDGLYLKITI